MLAKDVQLGDYSYRAFHGHAPRGNGVWAFKIGKDNIIWIGKSIDETTGTKQIDVSRWSSSLWPAPFSQALSKAKSLAAKNNIDTVIVLP